MLGWIRIGGVGALGRAGAVVALLVLATVGPAHAEEPLTQQLTRWLDEPGVRVVAVEVYSETCKPCMEAVPRWEALRQRYADRGLKLVVINIDDYESDTQCKKLPWRPDLLKCAPELADELGVQAVPQAFVWSWQGNLLVQGKTHIAEVERALQEYFDKNNPRVLVEAVGSEAKANQKVRRLIEDALGRDDKLTLIADRSEQRRLRKLRKDSHALARREDQQCEPGQEISANMRLVAEDFGDTMSLSLQDIESGRCGTTVTADWSHKKAKKSANKGIYQLLGRLRRRPPQMPGGTPASPPARAAMTPTFGGGQVTASLGRMRVEGKPRGARVEVSGPGDFARVVVLPTDLDGLEPGAYALAASAAGHVGRDVAATVRPDETVLVRVVLDLPGGIEVNGEPEGALVEVFDPAGEKLVARSFPVKGGGLAGGMYRVLVTREGYEEYDQEHLVQAGRTTSVSVTLRRGEVATTEPDSSLTGRPRSPASEGNAYGAVAWGSIGVFGVATGLSVWSGEKALLAQDEANKCAGDAETSGGSCSNSDYDSHVEDSKSAALQSDVASVVAAGALVSAGVFTVLALTSSTSTAIAPRPWANIAVTPGGVMLDARF